MPDGLDTSRRPTLFPPYYDYKSAERRSFLVITLAPLGVGTVTSTFPGARAGETAMIFTPGPRIRPKGAEAPQRLGPLQHYTCSSRCVLADRADRVRFEGE
jgi:hypothetical protein